MSIPLYQRYPIKLFNKTKSDKNDRIYELLLRVSKIRDNGAVYKDFTAACQKV